MHQTKINHYQAILALTLNEHKDTAKLPNVKTGLLICSQHGCFVIHLTRSLLAMGADPGPACQ